METAIVIRSSFGVICRPSQSVPRSVNLSSSKTYLLRLGTSGFSAGLAETKSAKGRIFRSQKKCFVVRSSTSSDSVDEPEAPIAPLQLESPVGQFLSQIMISHPHLVPAAVEQQLELLQTDRESENQDDNPSGTDLVLYRRIAEVKANDRKKALEEILYALVVQKFMEANVSLIPSITPSSPNTWPNQNENLESLHSPEAYEMIQNHLSLILGNRLSDTTSVAEISKLRVGQVYAASIMYGYFLKRVDQRFQLEKTMKILPQGIDDEERKKNESVKTESEAWAAGGVSPGGFGHGMKASKLRNYVMSFDGETLQKYATIRSKEAVTMIEKHTDALFGKPEVVMTPLGSIDPSNHDQINISFGGLKRLVLEAVTFGSFLWDVESHVDSRYHFVMN